MSFFWRAAVFALLCFRGWVSVWRVHLGRGASFQLKNERSPLQSRLTAHTNPAIEGLKERFGAPFAELLPLIPGKSGKCYIHSQAAGNQDVTMLRKLGGSIKMDTCKTHSKLTQNGVPGYFRICDCVAPPSEAFGLKFLEIGARDGQSLSTALFFESQLRWKGLCIEGNPKTFELLRKTRPACATVNAVIGDKNGTAQFVSFSSKNDAVRWEDAMSCMVGFGTCATIHTAKNYAQRNNLEYKVHDVPFFKLSDLFSSHRFSELKWLSVDVEGAELMVLQTVDFAKISAEHISTEGSNAEVAKLLVGKGYKNLGKITLDTWFVKP